MCNKEFRPMRAFITLTVMALCFVAGVQFAAPPSRGAALIAGTSEAPGGVAGLQEVSLRPVSTFQEVLSLLRQNYVSGISEEMEPTLARAAIRGALTSLGDPYTRYMDPEEYRAFLQESQGHFDGIGATLEMKEAPVVAGERKQEADESTLPLAKCQVCGADWLNPTHYKIVKSSRKGFEAEYVSEPPVYRRYRVTVVTPIPGGPAEKAGLKAGDMIIEVNDTSTFGMSLSEAVGRIRGKTGTAVSLLVSRPGTPKPLELKIVRSKIDFPTVEHKLVERNIGYLRINNFNEISAEKASDALTDLREKKVKGLLLDLRGNPGGALESCLETAGMFLPGGPIVYVQAKGAEPLPRLAPKQEHGFGLPVVALIDGGSASAAEILAGALQDRGVAKLVGERTFGKGLVQTVIRLKDSSALVVTTAKYFTPNHHIVDEKGIAPDKEVKQPDRAEFLSDKDTQAKVALQMLQEEIALKAVSPAHQQSHLLAPAAVH